MATCEEVNDYAQKKRYPGHRSCFNHEIITEMLKNDIPELCPKCFTAVAKHQIQMIGLNYTRSFILGNKLAALEEDYENLKENVKLLLEEKFK